MFDGFTALLWQLGVTPIESCTITAGHLQQRMQFNIATALQHVRIVGELAVTRWYVTDWWDDVLWFLFLGS